MLSTLDKYSFSILRCDGKDLSGIQLLGNSGLSISVYRLWSTNRNIWRTKVQTSYHRSNYVGTSRNGSSTKHYDANLHRSSFSFAIHNPGSQKSNFLRNVSIIFSTLIKYLTTNFFYLRVCVDYIRKKLLK